MGLQYLLWPGSGISWRRAGLNTDASRVFLLSTTYGAETTGLAAYLAVSAAYAERDVIAEMEMQGTKLRSGLEKVTEEAAMSEYVTFPGRPSCLVFATKDHDGQPSQAFRTLFIQELLRRGVLGQSFVISRRPHRRRHWPDHRCNGRGTGGLCAGS